MIILKFCAVQHWYKFWAVWIELSGDPIAYSLHLVPDGTQW